MFPSRQVGGCRVILDMEGLSLSQVTYFTPSFAAAVLEWVQKCLPARLKGVHIINQPYIFNMVFAIFKPFIQVRFINLRYKDDWVNGSVGKTVFCSEK